MPELQAVFVDRDGTIGGTGHSDFRGESEALGFDAAYICPHDAQDGCECRKPRPGMLLRAAAEQGLDLTRCAVIGDVGGTDMLAASAVGAIGILVRTGWGESSLSDHRNWLALIAPAYIATDLDDAVRWVLSAAR